MVCQCILFHWWSGCRFVELSNILLKNFYSSFGAEILGISRTATITALFKALSNLLINRFMKHGGKSKEIQKDT